MDTNDPRLEEAHKALQDGISSLVAGDDWKRYLMAQSIFHRYSFGNLMWLLGQARGRGVEASHFAGYRTWLKLGRQVRKGEKAFHVLAPLKFRKVVEGGEDVYGIRGFRVESTFEISQTEGEALPEVAKNFEGTSDAIREAFTKLAGWSAARNVPVSRKSTGDESLGFFHRDGYIVVSDTLSDLQALSILIHEVAHSLLHAADFDRHSRPTNEVEAESVAFIVMNVLGFNSSAWSFGYVAGWSEGDTKIVKTVGERVQKTAKMIVAALQASDESVE